MNIAIIGAGSVGGTLGRRFLACGHSVRYGVRDRAKYPDLDAGTPSEVTETAEVVVLATPWETTEAAIAQAGDLSGKVVVDATNPIASDFSGLIPGPSAGEQIAGWAKGARVVKAFNTIGYNVMASPGFSEGPATLLVAGDDSEAKAVVHRLASEIGFDPIDAGPLAMSGYLEALAWIWITLAVKQGLGRDIAFRLVRR